MEHHSVCLWAPLLLHGLKVLGTGTVSPAQQRWALYSCLRLAEQLLRLLAGTQEEMNAKIVESKMRSIKPTGHWEFTPNSRLWLHVNGRWQAVTLVNRDSKTGFFNFKDFGFPVDLSKTPWTPLPSLAEGDLVDSFQDGLHRQSQVACRIIAAKYAGGDVYTTEQVGLSEDRPPTAPAQEDPSSQKAVALISLSSQKMVTFSPEVFEERPLARRRRWSALEPREVLAPLQRKRLNALERQNAQQVASTWTTYTALQAHGKGTDTLATPTTAADGRNILVPSATIIQQRAVFALDLRSTRSTKSLKIFQRLQSTRSDRFLPSRSVRRISTPALEGNGGAKSRLGAKWRRGFKKAAASAAPKLAAVIMAARADQQDLSRALSEPEQRCLQSRPGSATAAYTPPAPISKQMDTPAPSGKQTRQTRLSVDAGVFARRDVLQVAAMERYGPRPAALIGKWKQSVSARQKVSHKTLAALTRENQRMQKTSEGVIRAKGRDGVYLPLALSLGYKLTVGQVRRISQRAERLGGAPFSLWLGSTLVAKMRLATVEQEGPKDKQQKQRSTVDALQKELKGWELRVIHCTEVMTGDPSASWMLVRLPQTAIQEYLQGVRSWRIEEDMIEGGVEDEDSGEEEIRRHDAAQMKKRPLRMEARRNAFQRIVYEPPTYAPPYFLYRTGQRLNLLQPPRLDDSLHLPASNYLFGEEKKAVGTTGVWRLGTLMGLDPLDGRYRMRYDTEGVEKTLVLSALDFHNHMQARDSRHKGVHVTKIGDLIFLNLGGVDAWVDVEVVMPPGPRARYRCVVRRRPLNHDQPPSAPFEADLNRVNHAVVPAGMPLWEFELLARKHTQEQYHQHLAFRNPLKSLDKEGTNKEEDEEEAGEEEVILMKPGMLNAAETNLKYMQYMWECGRLTPPERFARELEERDEDHSEMVQKNKDKNKMKGAVVREMDMRILFDSSLERHCGYHDRYSWLVATSNPGGGREEACVKHLVRACEQHLDSEYIPLVVDASELAHHVLQPRKYLAFPSQSLLQAWIRHLHHEDEPSYVMLTAAIAMKRVVVILAAVGQVFSPAERDKILDWFLGPFADEGHRVVVTAAAGSIDLERHQHHFHKFVVLRPLTSTQRMHGVRNLFPGEDSTLVLSQIQAHADLAEHPLLVDLLVASFKAHKALPLKPFDLCTQLTYDTLTAALGAEDEERAQAVATLLQALAFHLHTTREERITAQTMADLLGDDLTSGGGLANLTGDSGVEVAWRLLLELVDAGLLPLVTVVCAEEEDISKAGGEYVLQFTHPLFQQFFAAEHFLMVLASAQEGDSWAHLTGIPPMEELMTVPWWAKVVDLCDEASQGFFDDIVEHFYPSHQVYVTIERVQTRTGRHILTRMMERSTLVTSLILEGDPHPARYLTVDGDSALSVPLSAAMMQSRGRALLTSLHIIAAGMNCASVALLAQGLKDSALTELVLADNFIGPAGAASLAELFKLRPHRFLHVLSLAGNNVSGRGGQRRPDTLAPPEVLGGVQALAEALKVSKCFEVLDLSRNGIGEAGTRSLTPGIVASSSLQRLHLSGVPLPVGALKRNEVTKLELANCGCGPEDLLALAALLPQASKCSELHLGFNKLAGRTVSSEDEEVYGLDALAKVLSQHRGVTHLDLASNRIGAKGLAALLNVSLTKLSAARLRDGRGGSGRSTMTELLLHTHFRRNRQGTNYLSSAAGFHDGLTRKVALKWAADEEQRPDTPKLDTSALTAASLGRTLKLLDLSGNFLTPLGGKVLACLLKPTGISVAGQAAGDAAALRSRCVIRTLHLRDARLEAEGVQWVAEALLPGEGSTDKRWLSNTTLKELDVSANAIGGGAGLDAEACVAALAELLMTNRHLQTLLLPQNNLNAMHAVAIADALAPPPDPQLTIALTPFTGEESGLGIFAADSMPNPDNSALLQKDLKTLRMFQETIPVAELLTQTLYSLAVPNLCFEDSLLIQRLLLHNNTLSKVILPGPLVLPLREIRGREITELVLPNLGLLPQHLVVIAALLASPSPNLQTCILTNNKLVGRDLATQSDQENVGGIRVLAEALKVNRTLTLLDLSSNCIGPKGAWLLSEGVQPNQTLQALALSSNLLVGLNERNFGTFDASGLMALCAVVFPSEHTGYNTSLTTLDLGMNALGAEGAKVVSAMYSQRVCIPGLQNLDLAHNRIGAEGLLDLVDGFKFGELEEDVEEKLSYLNLAGNELTECGQTTEALHALTEVLLSVKGLCRLNLLDNQITDVDVLVEFFEKDPRLETICGFKTAQVTLNCSAMELASSDLEVVMVEMAFNKTAATIDLSRNGLSGQQVALLVEAFMENNNFGRHNQTATTLILTQNNLGGPPYEQGLPVFEDGLPLEHTAGMLALAELVAENAVITTITLPDNCIGPVGLELLVTNLHLNSTLQYLDLQGNLLGPAGCEVVAGLFVPATKGAHVNTTLLGLNIANNALWYSVEQEEDSLDRAYHLEIVGIEALCGALWRPVEEGLREVHPVLVLDLQGNDLCGDGAPEVAICLAEALANNATLQVYCDFPVKRVYRNPIRQEFYALPAPDEGESDSPWVSREPTPEPSPRGSACSETDYPEEAPTGVDVFHQDMSDPMALMKKLRK